MIQPDLLFQDVRHAARRLTRRPAFTLGAILSLALGIGASAAVFSLVDAVAIRQIPYKEPDRLVWIWHVWTGGDTGVFAIPDFVEHRARNRSFEDLAAFRLWSANLTGHARTERVSGLRVSENFFELLGVEAAVGRRFTEAEFGGRSARVAMLGHGLWTRRFGQDPAIVGQSLMLNGEPHTVLGILPPDFVFPLQEAELALPLAMESDPRRNQPRLNFLRLVGRLRPNVTPAQARADLDAITARLREMHPVANAGKRGVRLEPLHDAIVGTHGRTLFLLLAAINLVVVMMCVNLGNVFLAAAAARKKELAVSAALGASRLRLIKPTLIETFIIAGCGATAGLAIAQAIVRALLVMAPSTIPRADRAAIDVRVMLFALLVAATAALVFALAPVFQMRRIDAQEGLKGESRTSSGATTRRTHGRLLACQTALALTLLVLSGLFLRSFVRLQSTDPGFNAQGVLVSRLSLPSVQYRDAAAVAQFFDNFAARLRTLPGVEAVSAISILPLSGYRSTTSFSIEGRPAPPPDQRPLANYRIAGPDYFRTMQIPIVRGREFDARDRANAPAVAIVNQTLAQRLWPGETPLGATLGFDEGDSIRKVTIVGVAGDVRHMGLDQTPGNDIYVALHQIPQIDVGAVTNTLYWTIRTDRDPLALASSLTRTLANLNADVAAAGTRSMEQVLAQSMAARVFNTLLLGVFAAAALALAVVGVYGVAMQMVVQRKRELGIRMALGADNREIVRLVTRDATRPAVAGVLIGVFATILLSRFAASLLTEIDAADPGTFLAAAAILVGASLAAAGVPAWRATRTDTTIVLAAE